MIVLVASALAAQVQLDTDTRKLQVGETTQLRLTVVGGSADYRPTLPQVEGLRFAWVGSAQSAVMVNFKTERTVTYIWSVSALREGSPVIGPVDVSVGDEALQTNAVQLTVVPQVVSGDDVLSGELPEQAWRGQVVVYHLTFRTNRRILDANWSLPPYEGLIAEPSARATERQYTTVIDSQTVQIIELNTPLRLTEQGSHDLPSTVLTVQVPAQSSRRNSRFGMGLFTEVKNEVFSSEPTTLVVQELPPGQSDDWSGLVGEFEVESYLTDTRIAVGDSTTLVVRLSGDGALSGYELPELPQLGYRAYEDDAELELRVDETGFWNRVTFRRAIVPEGAGDLVLPALSLQVFDPVTEAYVDVVIPEQALTVLPGEPGASELQAFSDGQLDRRGEIAELGDDILPIHAGAGGSDLPRWWMLLASLPGLLFVALGFRRREAVEDPRVALRKRLESCDWNDLSAPRLHDGSSRCDGHVAELEDIFRDCLAFALKRPAAGIGLGDLSALPEALRGDCEALYKDLQAARYGGAQADATKVITLSRDGVKSSDIENLCSRVGGLGRRLCS